MKNPENYPIKGFAQVKIITNKIFQKKSFALVILCTVLHSGQFKDQKSLDRHKKTLHSAVTVRQASDTHIEKTASF